MANLETLELTINGSARSASDGISNLIASLSNLSNALVKPYSDLRDFNAELKKTKEYCKGIKLPDIAKATGASRVAKGASRNTGEYPLAPEHQNGVNNIDVSKMKFPDAKPKERYEAELAENVKAYRENLRMTREQNDAARKRMAQEKGMSDRMKGIFRSEMDVRGEQAKTIVEQSTKVDLLRFKYDALKQSLIDGAREGKLSNKQLAAGAIQLQKIEKDIYKAEHATDENKSAIQKLKESFGGMFKGVEKGWSRIKRIATSMLIRSAIRGLIKSIKEGVNNLYGWSKLNNGEFAKSLDTLKAKSLQLKNSIGASIAPVIQAAIPVIQSLANAAITAFNWVNQLISLLTGKNSWTKATENVDAYADSVKGAGGAAQQWLASFDELNVMTSGGGGGGGGSSVDYSDMFEEMYAFDGKIKEIADFLKSNFESIQAMAIATGVAIAAWKISDAFAETLPMLSKVAGLVGVGAVIAITLQAEWMLTNQYLKTGDEGWLITGALTTALGTTIAYAMTKKILGGAAAKWTIPIALAFSAVTDIVAVVKNTNVDALSKESLTTTILAGLKAGAAAGLVFMFVNGSVGWALALAGGVAIVTIGAVIGLKLLTKNNAITWGELALTEAQITDFVNQKMFATPVNLLIDKFNVIMEKKDKIRESLDQALLDIETNWNVFKLGVDKKESLEKIKSVIGDKENGLVKDIADLCDLNVSQLKLTFTNIEAYDGEGNKISSEDILSGVAGWDAVKKTMYAKGEELTKLLAEGAKGKLTPEMEEYTAQLLDEVTGMMGKIANAKEFGKATVDFKNAALSAMNENSFKGIIDSFNQYTETYESTIRQTLREQIASWYALADLTEDPELKAKYQKIADDLNAGFEQTVQEELGKQTAPGKQMILEWLQGSVKWENWSGIDYWVGVLQEQGFTADVFTKAIRQVMMNNGASQELIDVMKLVGFSGWEYLTEDLKKKFIQSIKLNDDVVNELKKVNVSATEIVNFTNWDKLTKKEKDELVKSIVNAYGASSIAALKSKFPEIKADEIVSVVDWTKFSNMEKLEFITAIKNAFGSETAKAAAKAAGINIGDLVQEGMKSKDDKIRKQAESWNGIIDTELTSDSHEIKVAAQQASLEGTCALISGTISALKPEVQPKMKSGSDTAIRDKVKSTVEGGTYTVGVGGGLKDGVTKGIQDSLNGRNYSITVSANYAEIGKKVKNAVESIVATLKVKSDGKDKVTIGGNANGGFVYSGEIFVANENGVPEMIGRFGNHGAVANTDQIVAGITRGVAEANSEQNTLLMQQNALLQAILQKDASVRLQASAALGRVASQSLNMYGAMVGV